VLSRRFLLVAVGVAFLAGLLLRFPDYLTAAATAVLAGFAGVQIVREILAGRRREQGGQLRLTGAAWLARRSCGAAIARAGSSDVTGWAQAVGMSEPLDRLEARFREVLTLASEAGEPQAGIGRSAFSAFVAAADRINECYETMLGGLGRPSEMTEGEWIVERQKRGERIRDSGLRFLEAAASRLSRLAPHQPFELKITEEDLHAVADHHES